MMRIADAIATGTPPPGSLVSLNPCPISFVATPTDAAAVSPFRQLRVLVVEDEALIALVLAEILKEMGFEVCASEATEEGAVAAALRERPDLMIVDSRLRRGSGISAVETIMLEQFIPHVFTTGDRLSGLALHPRAIVLQKPFLEADLALAIQRALGSEPT